MGQAACADEKETDETRNICTSPDSSKLKYPHITRDNVYKHNYNYK